jgi:hypothetical protein
MNEILEIDMKVYDDRGKEFVVHRVPAKKIKDEVWVKPELVVKARLDEITERHGLKLRQSMLLLLLEAPLGNFQEGFVFRKYNLNKMLFYQWKELENLGLSGSFDTYTFKADKRGPVPVELWDDLNELSNKAIIEMTGGKDSTLYVKLSKEGDTVAKSLWKEFDTPFQEVSKRVKDKIMPLDPEHLKEMVHSEYPEFKLKYTELDE